MMATASIAVEASISRSKFLASRWLRHSQAKLRSITRHLGSTSKPCASAGRLTISSRSRSRRQAVAVLDVGGVDHERERQALGVGQQVALAAVDLLARVPRVQPKAGPRTG
jgi:hypothetical protein